MLWPDSAPVTFFSRAAASFLLKIPFDFKIFVSKSMAFGLAVFPASQKPFVTQAHNTSATIPKITIPLNIKNLPPLATLSRFTTRAPFRPHTLPAACMKRPANEASLCPSPLSGYPDVHTPGHSLRRRLADAAVILERLIYGFIQLGIA